MALFEPTVESPRVRLPVVVPSARAPMKHPWMTLSEVLRTSAVWSEKIERPRTVQPFAFSTRPELPAGRRLPSSSIRTCASRAVAFGQAPETRTPGEAPGWVKPSIVVSEFTDGSWVAGRIVQIPVAVTQPGSVAAGMAKAMVSEPVPAGQPPVAVFVLAAVRASRSVQAGPPEAPAVLVTVIVAAWAVHAPTMPAARKAMGPDRRAWGRRDPGQRPCVDAWIG
jgi:hypothetical protein